VESKPKLVAVPDDDVAARVQAIERIEQLVAQGRSRLTAHRIVEIEREQAEAGRARRHTASR
jgi:protein-L-isoaspartate O-methyltransferase